MWIIIVVLDLLAFTRAYDDDWLLQNSSSLFVSWPSIDNAIIKFWKKHKWEITKWF